MADGLMGMVNVDFGAILNTLGMAATFIIVGTMVIVALLVFRYILRYNRRCFLLVKSGDGIILKVDKGWENTKKREFTLLRNKQVTCMYPENKHKIPEGKKEVLFGYVDNNTLGWMTVSNTHSFVPADINMMNFLVDMYARIDEATKTKQGFWDKYGHQVLWAGTIMVFLVVIILIMQRMDKILEMGASLGTQIVEAKKEQTSQLLSLLSVVLWQRKGR